MKKKIWILIILTTMISFSCKETLLDIKNENEFTEKTYFKTATQYNETVVATYAVFLHGGMMTREWYFIFDLLGNDGSETVNLLGNLLELAEYSYSATNSAVTNLWASLYRMNFRANFALEIMEDWVPANANEERLKKQYIAEAHWLRGYAYFNLVTNWGRVPLRLSYEDSQKNSFPRSSVEEIWKVVENDFILAIPDLPVDYPPADLGRATKGAAIAMLGKTYLYQKKYDLAATQFELMTKTPFHYLIDPKYDNLFIESSITSPEVVFAVNHLYVTGASTSGNREASSRTTHTARAQEYGFNDWDNINVPDPLVNSYKYPNPITGLPYIDPRAKMVFYGTPESGGKTQFCDNCPKGPIAYNYTFFGQRYRKYEPYEKQEFTESTKSSINTNVIRYADVLLMLAESYIESPSPKVSEAVSLINQVRNRQSVNAVNYPLTLNISEARDVMRRERRIELAGEQVRWFDLNRWGIAKEVLNQEKPAVFGQRQFESKHILFPIPVTEKSTNEELAKDIANDWN